MKILLNTTENWKEIKEAVKTAESFLKPLGVKYTLNKIDLDVSDESLYETTISWDWFKRKTTKSLSAILIYALGTSQDPKADAYGLICDKNKSLADFNLYGQHTKYNNKSCIEIYAKKTKKKYWGFDYTAYNLIHETLHIFEKNDGDLHKYLKENKTLDKFLKSLIPQTEEQPLVRRQADTFIHLANTFYPNTNLYITSFYRSPEEQDELYAQGRTKTGDIVTNAKGGESLHNYGVAFDIADRKRGYDLTNKEWQRLAKLWKALTDGYGEWGGSWVNIGFKDYPHFSNPLGYSLKDFQTNKIDYERYK